jgi:hypothetical protein
MIHGCVAARLKGHFTACQAAKFIQRQKQATWRNPAASGYNVRNEGAAVASTGRAGSFRE